jgi:hypothetical protein
MAATEQKKSYLVVKDFKGINTKANRTAISSEEFAWLENVQPVGFGNLKIVPKQDEVSYSSGGSMVNVTWSGTVHYMASGNLGGTEYMFAFFTNGGAQYVNLSSPAAPVTLAAATTFSGTDTAITQWKNERILIIDATYGYATFDGTNLVRVGSVGTVTVTAGGSGYTTPPIVTFSVPNNTGGIQATATATVGSNAVTAISITNNGTSYTSAPTVYIGTSGAVSWASTTAFQTGRLLLSGGNYYYVTVGGTTSSTAPTHTSGSAANGTCTLLYVADPNGGGTSAAATATVISQTGTGIASFSGRVWIADGRTVYYTAADSYYDFTSISAGNITITDATLHGDIIQIISANNFLYIFGTDSINVFSDVRVTTAGETLFTNTNVSASIGSEFKNSIFPYFRSIFFMNRYGVYALIGATTSKISDPLDGLFDDINFSQPITGGQCVINNILCAVYNFKYDDSGTERFIQAVFFDRKWFITSQGAQKRIAPSSVSGVLRMYATSDTDLWQLYTDKTSTINWEIQTALWSLSDPIRDKQALKFGVEATITGALEAQLNITVDAENRSSAATTLSNAVIWVNNNGYTIPWTNNSGNQIAWVPTGYQLYKYDAQQYGKYLGLTVTSSAPSSTINGFQLEHELRARF